MHVPERSRPTYVCMLCSSLCILFGLHAVPHWCDLQISSPPSVRKGTDPDSAIIQRKCRRYKRNARWRSSSGVPSLDGTGRRRPSTARPLDLPQRAIGRARTRADSIRYGHLLDLHVFVHLHRRRTPAARCERFGVEDGDAYGTRGGVSAVCLGRCTALLGP